MENIVNLHDLIWVEDRHMGGTTFKAETSKAIIQIRVSKHDTIPVEMYIGIKQGHTVINTNRHVMYSNSNYSLTHRFKDLQCGLDNIIKPTMHSVHVEEIRNLINTCK